MLGQLPKKVCIALMPSINKRAQIANTCTCSSFLCVSARWMRLLHGTSIDNFRQPQNGRREWDRKRRPSTAPKNCEQALHGIEVGQLEFAPRWCLLKGHRYKIYRGVNKGVHVLLSRTQAGPGRTVKQEQEKFLATTYKHFPGALYICTGPPEKVCIFC